MVHPHGLSRDSRDPLSIRSSIAEILVAGIKQQQVAASAAASMPAKRPARTRSLAAKGRGRRNRGSDGLMPVFNRARSVELPSDPSTGSEGDRRNAELLLFLLEDDDPRRDHQHDAAGDAVDAHVAEQTVDERNLGDDRHAELVP